MAEKLQPEQLMVFGRGVSPEGKLSKYSEDRAIRAVQYIHNCPAISKVIFSGSISYLFDGPSFEISEAKAMADLAKSNGLDEKHVEVIVEDRSTDTVTNILLNLDNIDHDKSLAYVTHSDHQPRIEWLFSHIIPDMPTVPVIAGRGSMVSELQEKLLLATQKLYFGNKPGAINEIREKNIRIQSLTKSAQWLTKRIFGDRSFSK